MTERRTDGDDGDLAGVHLAAARWHERLKGEAARSIVDGFEAWRAADPRHAAAFADVERAAAWTPLLAKAPELQALRQETRDRVAARSAGTGLRRRVVAAGVAMLLAVGGLYVVAGDALRGGAAPELADAARVYRTGVGERMAVTLSDGSNVTLNARSAIRVHYTAKARNLALIDGQALFQVAKNPARPFTVTAKGQSVTALGTEFDVRLDGGRFRVALLEGAVVVRDGAEVVAKLKPREVLEVSGGTVSIERHADMRRFVSWKDGLLMFANTPLRDAVAEMNRYAAKPIVLGDARVGAIRVSGTYKAEQSRDFLQAVELLFPVRVTNESSEKITISYAK